MPTGYTAAVQDGTITTLRAFAMQCARSFGALASMRDDHADAPIPFEFEPSTYYATALARARARLVELENMPPNEAQRQCQQEHSRHLARWKDSCDSLAYARVRYRAMIDHVDTWQPPTPEHQGLKDFMNSQLKKSLDWDCHPPSPMPTIKRWPAWLEAKKDQTREDIDYYTEHAAKVQQKATDNTKWVADLRASLLASFWQ